MIQYGLNETIPEQNSQGFALAFGGMVVLIVQFEGCLAWNS